VFCVGDGNNLVEERDEKDEGKENQIVVDSGNNGDIDDGDTNSSNVDVDNEE